ncbi:hypothetical protein J4E90_007611 [Alternaria incomplexa]|uniref:uncharacterized protein n=1 Tax=Alternaria incomplexa TaxID=1187928 RepID=UPI00221F25ED|nr:uncharacterized protein J4E90_007611 [Alternaria incomplexa]XP_051304124.1 uncharacterized protein J4E86_003951 [Alternaria arbusti]KAI4910180.1 hypothetical protein J4E90_007611 [Alternaria incomplexa]KAI4958351.1 hypothetical protein J4E86_003951 [Alternaria arbusti]
MEKLPQEILDNVFVHITHTEPAPISERFDGLCKPSVRTVLNSRLVARRWFESDVLIRDFVDIVSRTPLVWYSHRLPVLEEITEIPKYTRRFNQTITICGMDMGLVTLGEYDRSGPGRDELDKQNPVTQYLVHLLRKISSMEHFRYYPIHPNCLDGTWPKWKVSEQDRVSFETCFQGGLERARYGYPALKEGEYSWWGVQLESGWIFPKIMEAFQESQLWLKSVESPLFGNKASYCAISGRGDPLHSNFFRDSDPFQWFPKTLTRVAIDITRPMAAPLLNLGGLEELVNLEYLEITLSKTPETSIGDGGPFGAPFELSSWSSDLWYELENLKEFRLMSDYQHSFSEFDILNLLNFFPNLERLALGHILLASSHGNWCDLLQMLADFNLKELWLLDPCHIVYVGPQHHHQPHVDNDPDLAIEGTHNTDYHVVKYVSDEHVLDAAQDVCVIDIGTEWPADGCAYPRLSRDFRYYGFIFFEQLRDAYPSWWNAARSKKIVIEASGELSFTQEQEASDP